MDPDHAVFSGWALTALTSGPASGGLTAGLSRYPHQPCFAEAPSPRYSRTVRSPQPLLADLIGEAVGVLLEAVDVDLAGVETLALVALVEHQPKLAGTGRNRCDQAFDSLLMPFRPPFGESLLLLLFPVSRARRVPISNSSKRQLCCTAHVG